MSMALIIGRLAVNSQTIKHGAMNNTNTIGNRTQQSRCLMRPYHLGPVMLLDTPINHYAQERSIQQQRSVPDNPQYWPISAGNAAAITTRNRHTHICNTKTSTNISHNDLKRD
jgi:hypothetical protein